MYHQQKVRQSEQGTAPSQTPSSSWKKWWATLGPGIITAALVFGPGSLTITSRLGAVYGYSLLWLILVAIFFMVIFTEMGARVGIATQASLLQVIRNRWGNAVSVLLGLGIFLITASFQAGNTIGASLAAAELTQSSARPWIIAFTSMAVALLFLRSFYQKLEKIMIMLVGLMLASFLITLVLARPSLPSLAEGLIPSVPEGAEMLSIALIASSFSVVGAFYQSYLVQEKGWKAAQARQGIKESITGVCILGIISSCVLINAAAILHPQGIVVNTATDMGLALQPLYGNTATVIFMLGLFGASFSSLLGNATIGGSLLSDAFSAGRHLESKKVKSMIMLVMLIGAGIALKFGRLPLELIVFAQAVTILIAPLIGIALLWIANDKNIMGDLKNSRWKNTGAIAGLLLLLFLAFTHLRLQFFT